MINKDIESFYPLSPMQQGMLFHTIYAPQSGVYLDQTSGDLLGPLDVDAFEQAWQRVIDRHTALRTGFIWDGLKEPVQVVHRQVKLQLQRYDWRGMTLPEQDERMEAFLQENIRLGIELSKPPLMRLALMHVGQDAYRFVWCRHHLILDGWSVPVVLNEVLTFYDAFRRRERVRLPAPRPYRDYIVWLKQQDMKKAEAFWRQALAGLASPTRISIAKPAASAEPSYRQVEAQLSQQATTRLQEFARSQQVTLSTVAQGAWAVLLSRYSGQEEVIYGATVSGRPTEMEGVERMVGLFINTLPVRVEVRGDDEVGEWLRRSQQQQAEMRQYEYSPLVEVGRWGGVERVGEMFESLMVYESYPSEVGAEGMGAGLEVRELKILERTNYPLTIDVGPGPQLSLRIIYDLGRFDEASIERMLAHYQTLLESMTADANRPISQLQMLSHAELAQLLFGWNSTDACYPSDKTAHELFEARAAASPDKVAVVDGVKHLSYEGLMRRACRLSEYLVGLGVGRGVLAGVCMERSAEMVVGLLGVMKAGGAYVPLDPTYPADRLAFMLTDAEVAVLLTKEQIAGHLPTHWAQIICLDSDWDLIAGASAQGSTSAASADDLAYVIYTSGSTGRPKGVMISHRGLVNYLSWCTKAYEVEKGWGAPVHSPLAFDLTVTSLFAPLMTGQTVELMAEEDGLDGLANVMRDGRRFSLVKLTPAHLELLGHQLSAEQARDAAGAMVIGGEALSAEVVEFWRKNAPATKLFNEYGPTETVVGCCVYQVPVDQAHSGPIPIGRPIANTRLYLLDKFMRPVPVGVAGELYIGGDGLARGYHKRADLTGATFVPDPYGGRQGARLYKTGDLCRYSPDGVIEFIGRSDTQVKIRGFRIEPGEVEAALVRHPAIREAAVEAREDRIGDRRLVAYVVPNTEAPEAGELRAFLKRTLPDYMLPSAFVVLNELPLTPNGKLDRKALPAPDQAPLAAGETYVAPRTPAEQALAAIWSEVLGVNRVGVDDNFFDLGGHSLLAMQVVSRAREFFGVEVPLVKLFDHPTLAGQAHAFMESKAQEPRAELAPGPTIQRRSKSIDRQLAELDRLSEDEVKSLLQTEMQFARENI